jgi:hypothetical protein
VTTSELSRKPPYGTPKLGRKIYGQGLVVTVHSARQQCAGRRRQVTDLAHAASSGSGMRISVPSGR